MKADEMKRAIEGVDKLNKAFELGEDADAEWEFIRVKGMFPAYRLDVSPIDRCPDFTLIVVSEPEGTYQWQIEIAGEGVSPKVIEDHDHGISIKDKDKTGFEGYVEAALAGRGVLEEVLIEALQSFGVSIRG